MPYIPAEERDQLKASAPNTAGQLNYWITMYLWESWNWGEDVDAAVSGALVELGMYLGRNYGDGRPRYEDYNEVMGALECARREAIRRADDWGTGDYLPVALASLQSQLYDYAIANYEDRAIERNGDLPFAVV